MYDHLVGHVEACCRRIAQNQASNQELLRQIPCLLKECKRYA
jgi:hypothetical protein